jgi:hypothetical protein
MRGILLTLLPFLAATFADRGNFAVAEQQQDDEVAECEGWAAAGECNLNPKYMWEHCSAACGRLAEIDRAMADEIGEDVLFSSSPPTTSSTCVCACSWVPSRSCVEIAGARKWWEI